MSLNTKTPMRSVSVLTMASSVQSETAPMWSKASWRLRLASRKYRPVSSTPRPLAMRQNV